jgi:hypothetical protein
MIRAVRRKPAAGIALVLLVLGACSVGLIGCSGSLGAAKADFRKGRVAEAKNELVLLETDSRSWSNERRAEYALYRGLVHHSLGDRAAAGVWLAEAKALDRAQPHTLSDEDRVRLKLALESLASDTARPSP